MPTEIETPQNVDRVCNNGLDAMLGKPFKVLNDGFIRVVDYMGGDASIVQAARVSYGAGTKKVQEDKGLIGYLMRHRHTTPFEMPVIRLHVRVPMDCWRQWIRHRTASVNEYSTRYSLAIDSGQITEPDEWRLQGMGNRQGSEGFLPLHGSDPQCEVHHHLMPDGKCTCPSGGNYLSAREKSFHKLAREVYEERIEAGVAREQARKDLPLSTYTEAYWQINLHNLLHFLGLRCEEHAQWEIRQYANIILHDVVKIWVPWTYEAFMNASLNAMNITYTESLVTYDLVRNPNEPITTARVEKLCKKLDMGKRETTECVDKLKKLGFIFDI